MQLYVIGISEPAVALVTMLTSYDNDILSTPLRNKHRSSREMLKVQRNEYIHKEEDYMAINTNDMPDINCYNTKLGNKQLCARL